MWSSKSRGVAVAVVLTLCACKKDGNAWADEKYGEAAARAFLASAQTHSVEMMAGVPDEALRLPQPFVVLQRIPDENRLAFHPLNAELPSSMIASTLDLARGIVIVEKRREATANGTIVIKRRTMTNFKYSLFYAIEIYDRDSKTITVSASDTHDRDKLKAHLLALPP